LNYKIRKEKIDDAKADAQFSESASAFSAYY